MSVLRRRALIEQGNSIPYWYNIDEDWDYIIDQTGKYENPIIVNKKNLYGDKLSSIASIRDMSKLVVGYYDESSAKLIWEPLDNSGKTIVKHATSAYTINMKVSDYIAEHPTADVFMKLPEFWWRCWNINDNASTVAFKFVTEEPTDNNNWYHWDGNIFIGAYKGHVDEVNNIKLLRSIYSDITSNLGHNDFYNAARNKGAGYRCVTYEAHQMIALLFFGFNKTSFDDDYYTQAHPSVTGYTDSGLSDDDICTFWGLDLWNSSVEEHVDNLEGTGNPTTVNNNKFVGIIYDINHNVIRDAKGNGVSTIARPLRMILGNNADLIICDYDRANNYYMYSGVCSARPTSETYYAVRGDHIAGLKINILQNTTYNSRLQYEGNNEQYNGLNPPAITISSYTIDQTGPSNTDPKNMITFNTDNKVILDIRANSDFYALENKDWGTDTPEFIKMSKTDKLKTTRGTTLDANNYDIFMKLPEFWWKCENVENNEDKVKFSFTMINPNNNTWHHWDGKTFIGVYKSYYKNGKIYSRSGVTLTTPSPNITINTLKQSARNRGNGFQLITYEAHQMIALLEFGYLASVSKYGFYDYNNNYAPTETTGALDSYGFSTNYTHSIAGGRSWFNFWGLENWLSTVGDDEVLDNVVTNKRDGKVCADILDYNGNVVRSVYCDSVLKLSSYALPAVTKLVLGEYGDILPKSGISGASGIRCYDAYTRIHNNSTGYVFKKGCENFVAFVAETYDTPDSYNSKSRLLYKGNYTIGEEFQV